MKTYYLDQPGSLDNLAMRETPTPTPGPREVLMRVHATSLNYRDLGLALGTYKSPSMPLPLVPMSDGAGEIVAVGNGVTRVKVGDRVAGIFHQGWIGGPRRPEHPVGDLGGGIHGMLSEYVVLSEDGVVIIPEQLSFEEAATLPCAAVTAWNTLQVQRPLQAGETVLVQGSGGVSLFALQFAKLAGARVIATSSSDERLERMRALGADELVNYTTHPAWEDEVRALTGRRGVDLIVEVVGSMTQSLKCIRTGGRIGMVGQRGGQGVPASFGMIVGRHITVYGIGVGSRDDFEAMNRAIAMNNLKPVVDRVFAFEEAREAYRHLKDRAHFGKIVIAGPRGK
jgi:NADPH:quinone reductase-like Zn-dependent oxidoreductase